MSTPAASSSPPAPVPSEPLSVLRAAGRGFWLRAVGYGGLVMLALGIPTVLVPNGWFARMVAPDWWTYVLWVAASVLAGAVLAARRLPGAACPVEGRTAAGGGLALFAVACPTCNVLVVSALGTSGAMTLFAPVQPFLGVAAVALVAGALWRVLRTRAA